MGTAAYMSPEQAAGKPVDKRADIWSFGVVLLEMLTGGRLFEGETVSHTLAAVLTKDPDWSQLPAATPANLRRLLHRCLERDLKRRLRDMGDAFIELTAPDEPAAALPAPKESAAGRWIPWLVAVVALVAAAAGIGWGLFHTPAAQPRPVIRWTFTQQTPFGLPDLSRDGTRLAYTEFTGATARIMLRMTDQTEAKLLPGGDNAGGAVFSPDGQWLAFLGGDGRVTRLKKIPVAGGTQITLCDCVADGAISWGDDGTIVFSQGKTLMRVSDAGGTPQILTTPDQKKGETAHLLPYFLPGARALLFTITMGNTSQIAVLDLKKRSYHTIVNSGSNARYVPTGYLTYVRGGALFAVPFDAKRLMVTGSETPVADGLASVIADGGEYAFSDTGLLAYMAGEDQGGKTTLGWIDRKGVAQPFSEGKRWGTGRLSPDGLRIANSLNTDGNAGDIWIYEVERRTLNRLTSQGTSLNPIWTPDGRRVAYSATVSGKSGIYWVPADGSGKPELLAETNSVVVPNSWTPDGKTLVYSQPGTDKQSHLWKLSVAGDGPERKPVLLHDNSFGESNGQISPDGRWLAYSSNESGENNIYLQPFPGPGPKAPVSTQGGAAPRWARSGKELFYWNLARTDLMAVDIQTAPVLRLGLPQQLFKSFSGTTWDPAPDGQRFLIELFGTGSVVRMEAVDNWFDDLRRRVPVSK